MLKEMKGIRFQSVLIEFKSLLILKRKPCPSINEVWIMVQLF